MPEIQREAILAHLPVRRSFPLAFSVQPDVRLTSCCRLRQCDKSWSSSDVTLIDSVDDCFYVSVPCLPFAVSSQYRAHPRPSFSGRTPVFRFTMKTPHACSQSGGFFATLWSLTVS